MSTKAERVNIMKKTIRAKTRRISKIALITLLVMSFCFSGTLTAFANTEEATDIEYSVYVETSDDTGAGTDAVISIKINGVNGSTEFMELDSDKDDFEGGSKDTYLVHGKDVGEIKSIDVKAESDSWLLSTYDWLFDLINVNGYLFRNDAWLENDTRHIDFSGKDEDYGDVKHRFTVFTGDSWGAGTDADVYIKLHGATRTSDFICLHDRNDGDCYNNFENNSICSFTTAGLHVGEIKSIEVKIFSNRIDGLSGWELKKVYVDGTEFKFNKWIDVGYEPITAAASSKLTGSVFSDSSTLMPVLIIALCAAVAGDVVLAVLLSKSKKQKNAAQG